MAKLWQDDGISEINSFLYSIEYDKKEERRIAEEKIARLQELGGEIILNPNGFNKLSESDIWCRTADENKNIRQFRRDMIMYQPRRVVQRKIMSFATNKTALKYVKLNYSSDAIDEYIDNSKYWKKESVEVRVKDSNQRMKIVYAVNRQMNSVIFEYLKKFIVSTDSSFDNHLRAIEGKPLRREWVVWETDESLEQEQLVPEKPSKEEVNEVLKLLRTGHM